MVLSLAELKDAYAYRVPITDETAPYVAEFATTTPSTSPRRSATESRRKTSRPGRECATPSPWKRSSARATSPGCGGSTCGTPSQREVARDAVRRFVSVKEALAGHLERKTLFLFYTESGLGEESAAELAEAGVLVLDAEKLAGFETPSGL